MNDDKEDMAIIITKEEAKGIKWATAVLSGKTQGHLRTSTLVRHIYSLNAILDKLKGY